MKELFQQIANSIGAVYGFGGFVEFDNLAESITDPEQVVMFYECYDRVLMNVASSGGIVNVFPFELHIGKLSALEQDVSERLPIMNDCQEVANKVLIKLSQEDEVTNCYTTPFLSGTSSILAGKKMYGTYKGDPFSRCF